jgi:hypothetical protein
MLREINRASTDPRWPPTAEAIACAVTDTAQALRHFSVQARRHLAGKLTASDLCVAESVYQRRRRDLRREIENATRLLRGRFTRWDAASLLCVIVADALDDADRDVLVAIQVDVTQWTLDRFD